MQSRSFGLAALALLLILGAGSLAAAPRLVSQPLAEIAVYPERVAQAQVVSLNQSRIAAEIAGRIVDLPLEVGQTVARGAVIARLDCRDHELAVDRARATLDMAEARSALARQQGARAQELAQRNFIASEMLDARLAESKSAEAEVSAARAALASAEHTRGKCVLHAPFAAIVGQRLGSVGELATPGTPLYVLIDRGRIEVRAGLSPGEAAELGHTRAEPRFAGESGTARVRLIRASPVLDPATRQVEARLRFVSDTLPAGSGGRLIWRASTPHLPANMLVRRGAQLGVYVLDATQPRFIALPEAREGRPAAVDLPLDARIVTQGQQALR